MGGVAPSARTAQQTLEVEVCCVPRRNRQDICRHATAWARCVGPRNESAALLSLELIRRRRSNESIKTLNRLIFCGIYIENTN